MFREGHLGASRRAVRGTIEPTMVGFLHQQLQHSGVLDDKLLNGSALPGIRWYRRLGACARHEAISTRTCRLLLF